MHAIRLLSVPIELLTRERRVDKRLLLQRTGLFPLWWRAVVRRHDDGGGRRGRGGQGVGMHSVDVRELQKGLQRLGRGRGRGRVARLLVWLLERVQRVQRGVRVRQWRPGVDWNGRRGGLHGESGDAPLERAEVWQESRGW